MSNNLEKGAAAITHDLTMLRLAYEHQRLPFAYTAWFVHYRALLEFFDCSGRKETDLLPTEYVNDWSTKRQQKPDRAGKYIGAANALVAHMSDLRINYISDQVTSTSWTPDKELTEYLRELGRDFVKNLPDDKKLWFTKLETELQNLLGEIKPILSPLP